MHKLLLNKIILILLLSFSAISAQSFISSVPPSKNGTLTIIIGGFENDNGECWIALDNSEVVYESDDSVFIGKILPIVNNEVIVKIDSLTYGIYAIRVFHDENSNGKLDSNFLEIPTEDYGYSNNVSSWFGPPSWERAKFLFNQKNLKLEISVD